MEFDVYIMDLLTGKTFTGTLHMDNDKNGVFGETYYMLESNGIILTKQQLDYEKEMTDPIWVIGHYVAAQFEKDINEVKKRIKNNIL